MTPQEQKEHFIVQNKTFRKELDEVLQRIKKDSSKPTDPLDLNSFFRKSRERSIVITKLQEAIMWLGMDLKELDAPNPYPNSYNPANTIVDKTADGLKL